MTEDQWQAHIDACNNSGQSKQAYAEQHNLVYHRFLYWGRKLNKKKPDEFIAVRVKPAVNVVGALGVLEFPNGVRLVIQSPDLLTLLPSLLTRSTWIMWLPFNAKIWLYRKPIDFRKQIDGLVVLVADVLDKDPTSGQLFVFRNKNADKIKMLYFEDNGFWLLYKRYEKSRFTFPGIDDEAMELSMPQLQWLLSGIDFTQQKQPEKCHFTHFF